MSRFFVLALVLCVLGLSAVVGQRDAETCPEFVHTALHAVASVCEGIERNQVCHASFRVDAVAREPDTPLSFAVGESVGIDQVVSLRLSPLDQARDEWGVALLRVQANLPDTLPGQNVTFAAFGDTELTPLLSGDPVHYGQTFRLQTRIGGITCSGAALDGLLIQSPEGSRRVALTINGVDLELGSTIFVQAVAGDVMTIRTLEGSVIVRTAYGSSIVLAGSEVTIPMNDELEPGGAPALPIAYEQENLIALPLDLLDTVIAPAAPLTEALLDTVIETIQMGDLDDLLELAVLEEVSDPILTSVPAVITALPPLVPTLIAPLPTLIPPLPTLPPILPTLIPPLPTLPPILPTLIPPIPTLPPILPTLPPLFPKWTPRG